MFTGIITDIGIIKRVEPRDGANLYEIETKLDLKNAALGASIACAGVCLTVVAKTSNTFSVEVSNETLDVTTARDWQMGSKLNLEAALKLGDELGGHLVSGHVDGAGMLERMEPDGASTRMMFSVPDALAPFIAVKGSVCIDGVSLTVNSVQGNHFAVNIIPHTLAETTLGQIKPGVAANIEIDQLARYIARQLAYKN
jgi:riboflavin synthase